MDEFVEVNEPEVAADEPEMPVSEGIADAEIAPPEPEAAPEVAATEPEAEPEPEAVAVVEAEPEALEKDEVIGDERAQSIRVDGQVYHHIREARDGRWIYAPIRPRD